MIAGQNLVISPPPPPSFYGFYKSYNSGCLKCAYSIPFESIVFIFLLIILALIMWVLLRRTNAADRSNLMTVFKILFVLLNVLTPIPATFDVEFVSISAVGAQR